jgi:chitodextrinase
VSFTIEVIKGVEYVIFPATSGTYTVTYGQPAPDTTPPSAPTNVSATPVSTSQINLTWSASTDNTGIANYQVFRGGVQIATTTVTGYSDSGLASSTLYTYFVRARDVAGNISANSANAATSTLAPLAAGNYSIFTSQTPAVLSKSDGATTDYELGTKFQSSVDGTITAIRFYKSASETGTHTGRIWSSAGAQLASVTFANETASGWQTAQLAAPLAISANTIYVVSVNTGGTYYVKTDNGLGATVINSPLSTVIGSNGVYGNVGVFPTSSYMNSNYFRDVVFTNGTVTPPPQDTIAPSAPANLSATPVSSSQIDLSWAASTDNVGVTGYQVFRGSTQLATPITTTYSDTGLANSTLYTYFVRARDAAGNTSTSSVSVSTTTLKQATTTGANVAPLGTAYRWSKNTTATANTNQVAAAGLNDNNLTTDVNLNAGVAESGARYEAAGVIWSAARTIGSFTFINGTWVVNGGDGGFSAGVQLQFTTDGTTWTNASWPMTPSYTYNSAAVSGQAYTFSGTPASVRGVRVVGQVRSTENNSSYWANVREVQAF